jgi:Rieske Fe-S protein
VEERDNDVRVKLDGGMAVTAGHAVFATNSPINDRVTLHSKMAPYRTYAMAFTLPPGALPDALYWDMADPYHYARIVRGEAEDFLLVGGEDHKTGQANDADARYRRIDEWTQAHFAVRGPVAFRWSGQIMEPVDYMGFIGRNPGTDQHIYIATGDSGNGITHGTVAGILLTDLIMGRKNPWTKLYDPSRVTLRATGDFLKENLNVAGQYSDWATGSEIDSYDQIPPGGGAVVRRGMKKIAVYRDDQGTIHERSAICTHLYCIVAWNSIERTWDCPCHGSRFDAYGQVVNGPAITPLAEVESDEKVSR